jgi:outer membrane protein insertion porin family
VKACAVILILTASTIANADRIVGFRVRGHSKVTERTIELLGHRALGDDVAPADIPEVTAALLSSELFETVVVTLEPTGGGTIVVATVEDKQSWIAAPTVYVLPGSYAVGAGFAESDFRGEDQKILLYLQVGNRETFFFGTYLDPKVAGSDFFLRFDLLPRYRVNDEYDNHDARAPAIVRTSAETYLDAAVLGGYRFAWWLASDLRLRGAWVEYRDARDPAGNALPPPELDGFDVSVESHTVIDARGHRYGVTWGPSALLYTNIAIPGLSAYDYDDAMLRASYAWRIFDEHELSISGSAEVGWHMPFQQELTLGGATDNRGYAYQQFRGDTEATARVEYSIPLFRWRPLAFRALGFFDSGYIAFQHGAGNTLRDYLPVELGHSVRDAVGAGLRVYIRSVVVPLLGFDIGYGIEGRSPEFYFELGLTDF